MSVNTSDTHISVLNKKMRCEHDMKIHIKQMSHDI